MRAKTTLHLQEIEPVNRYKLMASLVVPRPIAWISTVSTNGITNLAPFSFFNVFGSKPPLVICQQGDRPEGGPKDTPQNIEQTGEYVVNIVDESLAEAMNQSCAPLPPNESEIDTLGLETTPADLVKVPMLKEAPANLECKLIEIRKYGENRIVVGEVKCLHIRKDLLDTDLMRISPNYQPIGKLHGNFYCRSDHRFEMIRPN